MISPARDVAFDILLRVENHGGFASELLHSDRLKDLSPEDRRLCTELVLGVLRWRSRLDASIANVSSQKLSKLDLEVLEALRLAAYQLGFLERIPAHAAVNESVELVKRKKKRSAAPFVNAVLRKLLTARELLQLGTLRVKNSAEMAVFYAHPEWIVERWLARYGTEAVERICAYDQQVPSTAFRLYGELSVSELTGAGIEHGPGRLLRSARVLKSGDLTLTRAFIERRVAIQDEASQLVALLVGRGERLLDCCAAPGGKTAILAERNPRSSIVAVEIYKHRSRLLQQRLRTHSNVEVITADATSLDTQVSFDRVLADVPCSGTGTLARNPEIKWRLKPHDFGDLHQRQTEILRAALRKMRPGGRLVYSTCSLEPEENENVVHEVLDRETGYEVLDLKVELQKLLAEGELIPTNLQELTDGPFLRIIPGHFGTDGFFAAQIAKRDTGS